jgi:hypothetical protein
MLHTNQTHLWRSLTVALGAALAALLLAACAARPPLQVDNPQVQAARQACQDTRDTEHDLCIEQQAIAALNPDVCRLLGIAVDDACLQSVYEAADDPAICDRLYLPGVVPACRAYYASLESAAPMQPAVTATASYEAAAGALIPYTSDEPSLALAVPAGWRIVEADFGPPAITLRGPPHGAEPEPLEATLTITVLPASSDTILDAWVESELARYPDLKPQVRRSEIMLSGEPAVVLDGLPGRFSNRQAFVQHGGRLYHIVVLPYDDPALVDLQAEAEAIWRAVTETWQFLD